MVKPKRLTHCKNGHEFTEENTAIEYWKGYMSRRCRICRKANKKIWDGENKVHAREYRRNYWGPWSQRIRKRVLKYYGNGKLECVCCGEITYQFLTLDHLNNNGQEERKKHGNQLNIMLKLIKANYPEGYQTLCWNCNLGKRSNKGQCPHKVMPKNKILITHDWQS